MTINATLNVPLPRALALGFVPLAGLVCVFAMLFGGGTRSGLWSDVLVQLPALVLLPWAVVRLSAAGVDRFGRWALALLAAIVLLPLLQLIPLPPAVWTALPGREQIVAGYQAAQLPLPWLPISLDAAETWRGLLSLIPAIAIFLAALSITLTARRVLIGLILLVAMFSVPVDLLQVMGGPDSPLRFYTITNRELAVGFFANANHHAALLYCTIPFAAGWAVGLTRDRAERRGIGLLLLAMSMGGAVIGVALTSSRAGALLVLVSGLACLLLVWRAHSGRMSRRTLYVSLGAVLAGALIAFQFGFVALQQKSDINDVMQDIRWTSAAITVKAAAANLPFGSGFGTFVPVFDMAAPQNLLRDRYLNHAHNDWLELWLTGGVPAVLLMFCFLAWFAIVTAAAWRRPPAGLSVVDAAMPRAASIVIGLLLLHSIVDYPLRTIALSVLFALSCGLLVPVSARYRAAVVPDAGLPGADADKPRHGQRPRHR